MLASRSYPVGSPLGAGDSTVRILVVTSREDLEIPRGTRERSARWTEMS